jgi:hypothetical protein
MVDHDRSISPTVEQVARESIRTQRRMQSNKKTVVLDMLLEHPFLDDGLTAEGAFNYLVGRVVEGKCFVGIKSSRELAFWMKKNGFTVVRNSQMNRYFWPRQEPDTHGEANLS